MPLQDDDDRFGLPDDERRPSDEWADLFDIEVVQPAGWDAADFHYSFYEEPITREEFMERVARSTTRPLRGP